MLTLVFPAIRDPKIVSSTLNLAASLQLSCQARLEAAFIYCKRI